MKTFLRDHKRRTTVPAAIVGGIMAFSAAAWACTPAAPNSFTNVVQTGGSPGAFFTATGQVDQPNTAYELVFLDSVQRQSAVCHHGGTVLLTRTSNGSGQLSSVTARVPFNAPRGQAEICYGKAGDRPSSYTPSDIYTVL